MITTLIIVVGCLLLFYCAYKAKPATNQHGKQITPPEQWQQAGSTFTIGTYNVQSGKDINGNRDIRRATKIIQTCDMVGIQEVHAATWLGQASQAQQLATGEGNSFGWLFAATRRRWFREHRGNAFLSSFPVKRWETRMLPDYSGKSFRNLVTLLLDINGTELAVLVTHLHTRQGREEQLKIVLEELQGYPHAVLLGDFNTRSDDPQLTALFEQTKCLDAISLTLPDYPHHDRIDWIICKGLKVENGIFEPAGVSDHPFFQITASFQ